MSDDKEEISIHPGFKLTLHPPANFNSSHQ